MADRQVMWRVQTADSGIKLLIIKLLLAAALVSPLLLAYPWIMNAYLRNWATRVVVGGRHIRYTGDAGSIASAWFKIVVLYVVTFSLYWWLRGRSAMKRYADAHIEWADAASASAVNNANAAVASSQRQAA